VLTDTTVREGYAVERALINKCNPILNKLPDFKMFYKPWERREFIEDKIAEESDLDLKLYEDELWDEITDLSAIRKIPVQELNLTLSWDFQEALFDKEADRKVVRSIVSHFQSIYFKEGRNRDNVIEELADGCNVTVNTVKNWVNGTTRPNLLQFINILNHFDLEVDLIPKRFERVDK
jgi:transcriptional regulator with XRE-family HTH domain